MRAYATSIMLIIGLLCAGSGPQPTPGAAALEAAVPRLVLAFYYPWYGTPTGPGGREAGGRYVHWEGVAADRHAISSSTHYPVDGPYDSRDPAALARQCRLARQAGIDGFIASWWGKDTFEDKAIAALLDACAAEGLKLTLYYETVPKARTPEAVARDLADVVSRYGSHPAFLTVRGRPVLFVYGRVLDELPLPRWRQVIDLIGKDPHAHPLLIADRVSDQAADLFDGLHVYNPAGDIAAASKKAEPLDAWADRAFAFWVDTARRRQRISCVTVIPGYDDTKIRKPGLKVDRDDGRLYTQLWRRAIASKPDWVLITSFNEWHEGSEIEPSDQFGDRYLNLTATMAREFKAGVSDAGPPAPAIPEPGR